MTHKNGKKILTKHRKIGIGTLTALPVLAGAGLSVASMFISQEDTPIKPEDWEVDGGETAQFTFDFEYQPDDKGVDVEIEQVSGPLIGFQETNKHFDVIGKTLTITFVQTDKKVSEQTVFSLNFVYSVGGKETKTQIKNLKINWQVHSLVIKYGIWPTNIYTQNNVSGEKQISLTVLLDGNDVTSQANITNSLSGKGVNVTSNSISWSGLPVGNQTCKVYAEYDGLTSEPISTTFNVYGADVVGGSKTIENIADVKKGQDKTPWQLQLNQPSSLNIEPTNVKFSLVNLSPTPTKDFISVDQTSGLVSWKPSDDSNPEPGSYSFNIKGEGEYAGAPFSATSEQIKLTIPTVSLNCQTQTIDVVKSSSKGYTYNFKNDIQEFKIGEVSCLDKATFSISSTPKQEIVISKEGSITFTNITEPETIIIKITDEDGVFSAETRPINIVPHSISLTGGATSLEYGNKRDTSAWNLFNDSGDPLLAKSMRAVGLDGETKVDGIYVDNDGYVFWDKDVAITVGTPLQFKILATGTGWYAGSYLSETITLTRQDDPTINIPEGIVATEGVPGSATEKPFTLNNVPSGVTQDTKWSVDDSTFSIGEDTGVLSWPGTLDADQTYTMNITATMGYYEVTTQFTLNVVEGAAIVEQDGKTEFYELNQRNTLFGKFNLTIAGEVIESPDWQIYEGESSTPSENFKMYLVGSTNSYAVVQEKKITTQNYTLKITASDDQGNSAETIVICHLYDITINVPKVYGDASTDINYQCSGSITTPDDPIPKPINPENGTWGSEWTGYFPLPAPPVNIIAETGEIYYQESTGSSIHTDFYHRFIISLTYMVKEGVFIKVEPVDAEIHIGAPSLSGGLAEINLDESGHYKADADHYWSLNVDSFEIPSGVTYTISSASEGLDGKVNIDDNGCVEITDGVSGSFTIQASYNNIEITTSVQVTQPEINYEIANLPENSTCYATKGYAGGLMNNLVVKKNGATLTSGVTWSKVSDESNSVNVNTKPLDKSCEVSWGTKDLVAGDSYNVTISATIEGVAEPLKCTLTLVVLEPSGIIEITGETEWNLNKDKASDHSITFEYVETKEVVVPSNISLGGNMSMLTESWDVDLNESKTAVIVHYLAAGEYGPLIDNDTGTINGTFYYKGSYINYSFSIKVNFIQE